MPEPTSEFRDPIHGFIPVYEHERRIIDTLPFQRLRLIRQLALQNYVYHGAEHSRFGHSLGVMHLAGEVTGRVVDKNSELVAQTLGWGTTDIASERDRLVHLARLAGLLHDLGHSPFSHAGEELLFPQGMRHENYTFPILGNPEMDEALNSATATTRVSTDDLRQILDPLGTSPAGFVRELVSSPWDVDKMDYLLRDSYYCGVKYGTYDLARLVDTLTLREGPGGGLVLAIEEGGLHALEGLILARYFMFIQVYFHDVRRAYDLLLVDFIQELLQDVRGEPRYPGPDALEGYLTWHDARVLQEAWSRQNSRQRNNAWRIVGRRHPKIVYETSVHPSPLETRAMSALERDARLQFPGTRFWLDAATSHPEQYRQEDLWVKRAHGTVQWSMLTRESTVLTGLQPINVHRLYALTDDDRSLRDNIREWAVRYMRNVT